MLLAIDVGNTNTAFAVFEGEALKADWRISTIKTRTGDEYAGLLFTLFSASKLDSAGIDGVVISSVVPAVVDPLLRFSRRHLGIDAPLLVSPEMDLGIRLKYNPPSDVGADRLANSVAAHAEYEGRVIVVDFGTGTTIDAISAEGEYLGGAIAPGVQISLDALVARAAKIRGVQLSAPEKAIGNTTADSLRSGMIFGFAGEVDALVDRFQAEMGGRAKVIATGGLADVIAPHSRTIECCDELLTLKGLRLIYERSQCNGSSCSNAHCGAG